jgi:hypothetical protein
MSRKWGSEMSSSNPRWFSSDQNQLNIRPIWCVVADVADATLWDQRGNIVQLGTRHFNGGATVYCSASIWGDGHASLKVVGVDRRTGRNVAVIMSAQQLTNWRVMQVDQQDVVGEFVNQWDSSDQSRRRAESIVEALTKHQPCPML